MKIHELESILDIAMVYSGEDINTAIRNYEIDMGYSLPKEFKEGVVNKYSNHIDIYKVDIERIILDIFTNTCHLLMDTNMNEFDYENMLVIIAQCNSEVYKSKTLAEVLTFIEILIMIMKTGNKEKSIGIYKKAIEMADTDSLVSAVRHLLNTWHKESELEIFKREEFTDSLATMVCMIVEKQMYERMLSQWMNKMVQEGISHKKVMEYISELSIPTGWETVGYNDIGYGINYSNIKFKFRNFLLNNEVIPEQGLRRRINSIDTDNMIYYLVDMLNESTMQWPCRGETLEF